MARRARRERPVPLLWRDTFGTEFLDVFIAIKRQECEKFGALVSDRDYEWYLDNA